MEVQIITIPWKKEDNAFPYQPISLMPIEKLYVKRLDEIIQKNTPKPSIEDLGAKTGQLHFSFQNFTSNLFC